MTGDVHLASQGQAASAGAPGPRPRSAAAGCPRPLLSGRWRHSKPACRPDLPPEPGALSASTARQPQAAQHRIPGPRPRQLLRLLPRGGMHPRGPLRWESGPSLWGHRGPWGWGCRQLPALVSTHTRTACTHTLVHRHAHVCTRSTLTHAHTSPCRLTCTHACSHTLATGTHSAHTSTPSHASHARTHRRWHPGPSPLQDVTPTSRAQVSSPQAQAQPIGGPLGPPQARPPGSPHHRCGPDPGRPTTLCFPRGSGARVGGS